MYLVLNPAFQRNVHHWEQVNPPWELPDYVGDLTWALQDTQAWIASGGIVDNMVVAAPPTLPQPVAPVTVNLRLRYQTETPCSKVQQSDKVEHMLDKGCGWGLGLCDGLEDFRQGEPVSSCSWVITDLPCPGSVMAWIPTCQCCQALRHDCYGLAAKACGQCQHKDLSGRGCQGELPVSSWGILVLTRW